MSAHVWVHAETLDPRRCDRGDLSHSYQLFGKMPVRCFGRKALHCSVKAEKGSPKANSFREKLKQNPAYQRLKQNTWQQTYKPSGKCL